MSQNVTQNKSNASPIPNLTEITALISILQETMQVLLNYKQICKADVQEASNSLSLCESKDTTIPQKTKLSKRAQSKECYKKFRYNHRDSTAFADKELAQTFKKAYSDGYFRDEIRYYHVPANSVRYEYNLLNQHQQENVSDLLSIVYNELDIRRKLIAYMDKDIAELPLLQLGDSISQPLRLLQLIHAHLNKFTLVHKVMLPLHT